MKSRITATAAAIALVLTAGGALAACGGSSSSDTTVTADTQSDGELQMEGAWARTSAAGATMGAAYLTITSPVDDALVDVKVDPAVAMMAQIHEVVMASDTSMAPADSMMSPGSTMAPEMKMQEVDEIALPAGEKVELRPGGYHIMLMQLSKPLEAGTSFDITLVFKNAGEKVVSFTVRDDAP
jgi:copper(I)-binding protein